jgi:hypothetical protein
MKPELFVVALAVGAGALALWADVRVPRLQPKELRGVLLHTFIAFAVLHVVAGWIGAPASGTLAVAMAALLGIALPAIVYAFLAGIWAIRMFQDAYKATR